MAENSRKFAIILAAGDGKRMKSDRPKVLCEVLYKPMLRWVEDACRAAGLSEIVVVAGEQRSLLEQTVKPNCRFVTQEQRRGTGHAVMVAKSYLAGGGSVMVLYGDAPFISPQTINESYRQHVENQNAITVVTARVADPTGYGRIVREPDGHICAIVEQKDANAEQLAINEINSGLYWFDAAFLNKALELITDHNAQREYYLTDAIAIAVHADLPVEAFISTDGDEILGANDRKGLQLLNRIARERILQKHLNNGVDIPFPEGIIIGPEVQIEHDARILPGTVLLGKTVIGAHSEIGPNSRLENVKIGARTLIFSSVLTDASVGEDTTIGPFTQLRPNSHVGNGVKIGDFVEIKNSTIGDQTSIAHLTYIGDSDVGKLCNFGCGVVTANYDGKKKYRTVVEDRAFIGCNTNLVPPVRIGEGAYTAAGTTIVEDVPAGALAVGRARQQVKEGWADRNISFKKE